MAPSSEPNQITGERRGARRHRRKIVVDLWPETPTRCSGSCDQTFPSRAVTDNISLSGILLVTDRLYAVDAVLWLRLRLGRQTQFIKAIVRRSAVRSSASVALYHIGVEYVPCPQTVRFIAAARDLLATMSALDTPAKAKVAYSVRWTPFRF